MIEVDEKHGEARSMPGSGGHGILQAVAHQSAVRQFGEIVVLACSKHVAEVFLRGARDRLRVQRSKHQVLVGFPELNGAGFRGIRLRQCSFFTQSEQLGSQLIRLCVELGEHALRCSDCMRFGMLDR
ncbi:MAG: hypothetical protein ABIS07_00285 [Dokdonella sp.]